MTDITFEQGDKGALAFIDNKEIIKHLEDQGYSIQDLSEGNSLKSLDQKFMALKSFGQLENLSHIGKWLLCWHWYYDTIKISVWDSAEQVREGQAATINANGVVFTGDYAYQEILEVWEELNKRLGV